MGASYDKSSRRQIAVESLRGPCAKRDPMPASQISHQLAAKRPSIAPTMLEAGVARNMTPPSAKALLDLRTTPHWTHAEVGDALRAALSSEVHIVSERLVPCETPTSSRLLPTMQAARPQARSYGSATCSDWVFLRHVDAVKCGPGDTLRSHTADEWVDIEQVRAARSFYREVALGYLTGTP